MERIFSTIDSVLKKFPLDEELKAPLRIELARALVADAEADRQAIEALFNAAKAVQARFSPLHDLESLSIRQLKQLAREKEIPGYGLLTKPQLVAALAAAELAPVAANAE